MTSGVLGIYQYHGVIKMILHAGELTKICCPQRKGYYQNYDLSVVHIRPDYWVLFVFRYTDYTDARDPLQPYVEQDKRMSVDLYASYDQLRSPPILIREDWMSNKEQPWVLWYVMGFWTSF